MSFFNLYPYTDFHEMNLDMILSMMKKVTEQMNYFIKINTIKYADPFQWNITTQYEANTIVMDANTGIAYISVAPVPSGISISNTDYWTPVFDLSQMFTGFNENLTLNDEQLNITSSTNYAVGDWLIWKNKLYEVIATITAGDLLIEGTNINRITIEDVANAIYNNIDNINIDINNINTKIDNERVANVRDYGAVGDGVTDDTQSFVDAIATGLPVYVPDGKYFITAEIQTEDLVLFGTGTIYKTDDAINVFYIKNANKVDISGITFEDSGNYTHDDYAIIRIELSKNINIHDCIFKKVENYGGVMLFKSDDASVCHNKFYDTGYMGIWVAGECNNVDLSENIFDEVVDYLHGNSYCIALSCYQYGAVNVTGNAYRNKNITINGNVCKTTNGFWEALDCHGAVNITFSNNVIKGFKVGIAALSNYSGNYSTENCCIIGNTIDLTGTPATGITEYSGISVALGNTGLPSCGVVSGNTIMCKDSLKTTYGITLQTDDTTISDNTIKGVDKGIYYNFGERNKVVNNMILDVTNAFEFFATTNLCTCDFINNKIHGATLGIKAPGNINPAASMFYFEGTIYDNVTSIIDSISNILPDAYTAVPAANKYARANAKVKNINYTGVGDVLYWVSGPERHNAGLGSWGAIKSVSP